MNEIGKEILKRDLLAFKTKEELVEMDMNLLDEIDNLQSKIDKAFKLLQLLHYKFKDEDNIHNEIEDIQKCLKEEK